ncbi:MAG TPA: ferredoxin reductase [Polyangiaceae bacterium]
MTAPLRSLWTEMLDVAAMAATPLVPSSYIELVAPLAATHVRYARIEALRHEAGGAVTLTLRPGRGWTTHRAGQFVKVGVEVDGRILTRTYSISSAPEERGGCFTITVKAIGKVSNALAKAKVGSYLFVDRPQGEFVLPEETPAKLLFVTGGSGITTVASMLRSLRTRVEPFDVVHVHYVPKSGDMICGVELRRFAMENPAYRLVIVAVEEGGKLLDASELARMVPDHAEREAWACGPESLLDAAVTHVGERTHVERFRPKLAPIDPNARGGKVRFGRSKKEVEAQAQTPILDVALAAGVDAPHGCRIGICHSCDATLKSGCVRDLRTGALVSEEGARIQPCVCAAAGDVDVDL